MTATILEHETMEAPTTQREPGRNAHIVLIPPHLRGKTTPQAYVLEARIEGNKIEALCGHRWIPQHNPADLPVCPKCLEIYKHDPHGKGDREDLPDA